MAKSSIKNLTMLQEAAPQPQPKLEKQGSGLKKGLKKVRNGVKTVTDRMKDRSTRRLNRTPGPVPTPAAPPAQGSTSTASELQRGGSLKDKLKEKFSRSRRGEIFVHVDLPGSLPLHRSTYLHHKDYNVTLV